MPEYIRKLMVLISFTLLVVTIIWWKGKEIHQKINTQQDTHNPYKHSQDTIIDGNRVLNPAGQYWQADTVDIIIDEIYWPGKGIIKDYGDTTSLLNAIIFVESCNNDSAYRASEDAVGCLQIRKTMVNDVNRILKRKKSTLRFTYDDRWSRNKSIQMFEIYCDHYNLTTAEEIARCWNGGPRGINNPATVGYWKKVKDKINS
jgi:hypothetical protein